MKKFIVIKVGVDDEGDGEWAHQMCPGVFDTPDAALTEFRKDWNKVEFELHQISTGTYQIVHYEYGDALVEGLIVPIEMPPSEISMEAVFSPLFPEGAKITGENHFPVYDTVTGEVTVDISVRYEVDGKEGSFLCHLAKGTS